jgi:hypothetical protein
MQQHGGANQFGIGRGFGRGDGGGVPPDAQDVGQVMRTVGPGGAKFSDQAGGWDIITGATGGYIIGFILAAAVVGWLAERGADRRVVPMIGVLLLGSVLIYAIGVPWLANWAPAGDGVKFGWSQAYEFGVQPFILGDLIKLAVAASLLPAGWALLQRTGFGRDNKEDGPKAGLL